MAGISDHEGTDKIKTEPMNQEPLDPRILEMIKEEVAKAFEQEIPMVMDELKEVIKFDLEEKEEKASGKEIEHRACTLKEFVMVKSKEYEGQVDPILSHRLSQINFCYNCYKPGHNRADCPELNHRGGSGRKLEIPNVKGRVFHISAKEARTITEVVSGMVNRKLRKSSSSEDNGSELWSNVNHDLLFIIMMQLGVPDFIAFSGVCKSWRLVAHCYWNKFMASKQPMYLSISRHLKDKKCYIEDYKRRKLKRTLPHSNNRSCIGLTCGYLIFYGIKTNDFWLVKPFTSKQLHFPGFRLVVHSMFPKDIRGILVFSLAMSGWVFVVSNKYTTVISFCLAGKQANWRHISCYSGNIHDLHFFKGKIYMINSRNQLWELRLNPEPTLTLCQMKNFTWQTIAPLEFVSTGENLYVRDTSQEDVFIEVDFNEMEWVSSERTIGEYSVFVSNYLKCVAAIKPDTWIHPWTQYERLNFSHSKRMDTCPAADMWYFPHECLYDNDYGNRGTNTTDQAGPFGTKDMENGALLNILQD